MSSSAMSSLRDVSGTEGLDLPSVPEPQLPAGQAPPGLWEGLATQVAEHGFNSSKPSAVHALCP